MAHNIPHHDALYSPPWRIIFPTMTHYIPHDAALYSPPWRIIFTTMEHCMDCIMHKWANQHWKKTNEIYVIDSNNLINIWVSHSGSDHFGHWFCYVFVFICIYSFYPVLHVAARFFSKSSKCGLAHLCTMPSIFSTMPHYSPWFYTSKHRIFLTMRQKYSPLRIMFPTMRSHKPHHGALYPPPCMAHFIPYRYN